MPKAPSARSTSKRVSRKADPLFAVTTSQIAADGEDASAAKLAALKQQKDALGHQIAAEQQSAGSESQRLNTVLAGTQSAIADLRGQIDLQAQRVQLAEGLVSAAQELLAKGYMSAVESKRREDLRLEQKQNLANLPAS